MRTVLLIAAAVLLVLPGAARSQQAGRPTPPAPPPPRPPQQSDRVGLELNRLAPRQGGCQVYLVGRNGTGRGFTTL